MAKIKLLCLRFWSDGFVEITVRTPMTNSNNQTDEREC